MYVKSKRLPEIVVVSMEIGLHDVQQFVGICRVTVHSILVK